MKARILLAVGLLAFAGLTRAQENTLPSQPHLLVKGEASRTVEPDRFTIVVQLKATDLSAENARKQVAADAATVLQVYHRNHAIRGLVEASSLSMQPAYDYEQKGQVFKGTRVQRSLTATFGSLDDVRACLALITTSDGLQISGISTAYSKEAEVRGQLKKEAAAQTRSTAQDLASAYGVRLSGLYAISDVAPQFAYGVRAGTWPQPKAMLPAPPAPPAAVADIAATVDAMEAGKIVLSENVYAIFLIAQ